MNKTRGSARFFRARGSRESGEGVGFGKGSPSPPEVESGEGAVLSLSD